MTIYAYIYTHIYLHMNAPNSKLQPLPQTLQDDKYLLPALWPCMLRFSLGSLRQDPPRSWHLEGVEDASSFLFLKKGCAATPAPPNLSSCEDKKGDEESSHTWIPSFGNDDDDTDEDDDEDKCGAIAIFAAYAILLQLMWNCH